MRTRQLLNLEYSSLTDDEKLIGISKHLNAYDGVRDMVYQIIERHKVIREQVGIELTPILTLDTHIFNSNIVRTKDLDSIKLDYEYVVNAFDMLKHYSH